MHDIMFSKTHSVKLYICIMCKNIKREKSAWAINGKGFYCNICQNNYYDALELLSEISK